MGLLDNACQLPGEFRRCRIGQGIGQRRAGFRRAGRCLAGEACRPVQRGLVNEALHDKLPVRRRRFKAAQSLGTPAKDPQRLGLQQDQPCFRRPVGGRARHHGKRVGRPAGVEQRPGAFGERVGIVGRRHRCRLEYRKGFNNRAAVAQHPAKSQPRLQGLGGVGCHRAQRSLGGVHGTASLQHRGM